MPDMIFVSLENWDDVWRRNQFLCATLARRHPNMQIVFVGLPRNVVRQARSLDLTPLMKRATLRLKDFPNITVTRSLRVAPERYDWGLHFNESLFARNVRNAVSLARLRHPLLWLNAHQSHFLVKMIPHSGLIYDITDDWISSTQTAIDQRRTIAADRWLCEHSDAVIVCSQKLHQLKLELTQNLHLVPNGVDAAHYANVCDRTQPLPDAVARLPRPVLGYTGTLHSDRLDIGLLKGLSKAVKTGSIVLIGPNYLSHTQTQDLKATGRVHVMPPVPYSQVPTYMRAFDVCITPHVVSPFTESLNPIKLWEYLATGKPIVSTPVAGFRDYGTLVHLAQGAEEFAKSVLAALAESPEKAGVRKSEALRHSWEIRADAVEAILCAARLENERKNVMGGVLR